MLRLYDDREEEFRTCHLAKELTQQYDYAFENIEYLRRALSELSNYSKRSSFYSGTRGQQQQQSFKNEFFFKMFKSSMLCIFVYYMLTRGLKSLTSFSRMI